MSKIHLKEEFEERVRELVDKYGWNVTGATQEVCNVFEVPYTESIGRVYRKKLQSKDKDPIRVIEDSEEFKKARKFKSKKSKYYMITWAQSETKVHKKFWNNMKAYADYLGASIHVIAGRYRNPTSLRASRVTKKEEFWDREVLPYLDANRQNIHEYVAVLSDLKIQPTAKTPLSGLNGITAKESCIVGHPSVHLDSLPVLEGYVNKLMMTTGAVTVPNYTDTKAGKWAEQYHEYGFVLIEVDGDRFYPRQIQSDKKGNFYDLCYKVHENKVTRHKEPIPAIIFGDIHKGNEDKESLSTSVKMATVMNAQKIVGHDILDGYSINPHEFNNPFIQLNKEDVSLEEELEESKMFLKTLSDVFPEVVSVASNHNDFLDRWITNNDWRKNKFRKIYLELANIKAQGLDGDKGMFHYLVDQMEIDNITTLSYDSSYIVKGYELALHFDKGASGSRGSMNQFKNLSIKTIGAHGHTPKRAGSAIMVGTNTKKRLGYNRGLSSWVHGNAIIYPNGTATHIHIIDGKYTTFKLD